MPFVVRDSHSCLRPSKQVQTGVFGAAHQSVHLKMSYNPWVHVRTNSFSVSSRLNYRFAVQTCVKSDAAVFSQFAAWVKQPEACFLQVETFPTTAIISLYSCHTLQAKALVRLHCKPWPGVCSDVVTCLKVREFLWIIFHQNAVLWTSRLKNMAGCTARREQLRWKCPT